MKWRWNLRVTQQPAVDLRGLVRRDVVDDQVDVEIVSGTERLMRFKKLPELRARCRSVMSAITLPDAMSSAAYRSLVPCRT